MKSARNLLMLCLAVLTLGVFGSANAQYVGVNEGSQLTTVAAVLKNPVDDQYVRLQGKITKRLKKEHYEFTDKTGTMRVEIDDDVFMNQRVSNDTVIEIFGEVETEFMRSPEIDVKRLTIVTP